MEESSDSVELDEVVSSVSSVSSSSLSLLAAIRSVIATADWNLKKHDYIFSEYGTFEIKKTESFCSTLLKISYLLHENSLSYIHGIIELKNVHFDSYTFLYCNVYILYTYMIYQKAV